MPDSTGPEDHGDFRGFVPPDRINFSALGRSLRDLPLLGDNPLLSMQVTNLEVVDKFITQLEHKLLRQLIADEETPVPEAIFVLAQSQMWIFAAYELLRTWRQRISEIVKWADCGCLEPRLAKLQETDDYFHLGRSVLAGQVKEAIDSPELVSALRKSKKSTHFLFGWIEAIRVSLAKHEITSRKNKNKPTAAAPGFGRINPYCGALDFEIENGKYSLRTINRREIAEDIRALDADNVPSDGEIEEFDGLMRGAD